MAHLKKANAMVVHPRVSGRGWNKIRQAAKQDIRATDLTEQARSILGGSLNPDQYLFTHCTIVASVDVENAPGVKLGKVRVGSKTIDRRFANYFIKPACNQYVNNNGDSWSREVLKKSFHTFIGGHNFQEHVQIEEKSKGRILDAVSRDIGDSLYIDILVATDRKHTQLVRDILAQDMTTLSMGCTTDFTICSKCGHVAADETELCDCVRYEKLNTFMDDSGVKRVVAELCGHESVGDTGGVRFIEASWVGTPAFQGAVLRNILALEDTDRAESEIRKMLASPAPSANWSDGAMMKAASTFRLAADFGEDDPPEEAPAQAGPKAPFQDLEDSVYKSISDRVRQRIEKDLAPARTEPPAADWTNNTIIKEGSTDTNFLNALAKTPFIKFVDFLRAGQINLEWNPKDAKYEDVVILVKETAAGFGFQVTRPKLLGPGKIVFSFFPKTTSLDSQVYKRAMFAACHSASSDAAVVNAAAEINEAFGLKVSRDLYRLALNTGPIADPTLYIATCRKHAKRPLSQADVRVLIRLGSLLANWEGRNQLSQRPPQE